MIRNLKRLKASEGQEQSDTSARTTSGATGTLLEWDVNRSCIDAEVKEANSTSEKTYRGGQNRVPWRSVVAALYSSENQEA
ncbi:hypothetical protein ElyMa_001353500 [Elysia marginata]|uniref:Uncharacterized protein n=1 Tax=Elysia marginata TaxID=1093978 RepID=A0AAV4IM46_9GAST|nr:hypothetical protein ElyMa_001353500 [Elysia marginata]